MWGYETWRRTPQRQAKTGKGRKRRGKAGKGWEGAERHAKAPHEARAVRLSGMPNFKSMRTAEGDDMGIRNMATDSTKTDKDRQRQERHGKAPRKSRAGVYCGAGMMRVVKFVFTAGAVQGVLPLELQTPLDVS